MKTKFLFLSCLLIGNACAAERIVGPWVVDPAARTATIAWLVETSDVKVGSSPDHLTESVPVLHYEKVSLTGLKPGETIYYDAFGSHEGTGHFKTPSPPDTPFHFVVFGDTRTRDALHRRIVAAISKDDPDFVVHTGDLVQNGYDTAQWPNFFDIEHNLLRQTVFFPVLGNHERDNAQFAEFFDLKNPYYSFNWGSAHFALIDSDVANTAPDAGARERFWSEQTQWLQNDLARSQDAQFRFVVMHHPPFTVNHKNVGHVSTETPTLVPMFEKYHVTAVFAGHDHNYQHHFKDGIHYVITGGGGAPLAPADKPLPDITLKVESIEHFVRVHVTGDRALVEAIALDGRLIDKFELTGFAAKDGSANK
jgi:acid phosphatase type 7